MPALDGVRALSVVLVMGVHLHYGHFVPVPAGFLGVEVFFVLSGFLITTILLEEHARSDRIHLGHFYARRAPRAPAAPAPRGAPRAGARVLRRRAGRLDRARNG